MSIDYLFLMFLFSICCYTFALCVVLLMSMRLKKKLTRLNQILQYLEVQYKIEITDWDILN